MYNFENDPTKKILNLGRSAVSNVELLAILLGTGTKNKTVIQLAEEVMEMADHDLYNLGKFSAEQFMRIEGIGERKASIILSFLELGRRRNATNRTIAPKINKSTVAYEYMKTYFQDLDHEQFWVMGVSRSNRVLGVKQISQGGRAGTLADGKIIFKELLEMKACGCILFHNHPSGNLNPSAPDIELTKKLAQFGRLIDLPVLEHIIMTDEGYYSFADNGRI